MAKKNDKNSEVVLNETVDETTESQKAKKLESQTIR